MMLGISMAGISETLNLGTNLGLDPKVLSAIINAASGRCWSSDTYNPVPGVIPTVPASNGYKVLLENIKEKDQQSWQLI